MSACRILESYNDAGEKVQIRSIHIGGVEVSASGGVIRTVLGSCISVCLRDPRMQVGGMNHFMLPEGDSATFNPASYGVHAMELLINQCMRVGADRRFLEAKVFGGGKMFSCESSSDSVARRNIEFVLKFLEDEGIPIVSKDLGGRGGREILFYPATGRVRLKRLSQNDQTIAKQEASYQQLRPKVELEDDSITLF